MAISNTAVRIIVSVISIPVIVLLCYLGQYYFLILVLGISLISYYEFWSFVRNKEINTDLFIGLISIAIIVFNTLIDFVELHYLLSIILLLLSAVELFRNKGSAIINLGSSLLGILYFGFFSSALILLRELYIDNYEKGGFLIISILASIWICDSAAFFGGTALGKHKLSPRISPNKSWEGAIFGLLFAVFTMIISKLIITDFLSWKEVIIIGLIVGIIGQVGDFVESLFKRDVGIKDSSKLIPGHGGVFDRFDSLLYSAPAILLYLKLLS